MPIAARVVAGVSLPIVLGFVSSCSAGAGGAEGESVNLQIAESVAAGPVDAKAQTIVAAAQAFLSTLTEAQRKAVVYDLRDNEQRARWSNFPTSFVPRGGIMRKDLNARQNAALDALLSQVLSARGLRNARLQMAADDLLVGGDGPQADFGSGFYYAAFVGEPATDKPWMFQFGGHHLAINATFVGSRASFSPMLTGGQPLTVPFEGQNVYITRDEVAAGDAFLAALSAQQRSKAIRGGEAINILLGPGEQGTAVAPEGIRGSELNERQKQLLLAVIQARIGHFNDRDAAAKLAAARASLDDTYFGWWGPVQPAGAAYFRVTGPQLVLEYGPQEMAGGSPTEHAHNMYRDPANDYGAAWLAAK